jgi:4-amino-4-deoxy-L-arabinose transferase-like glycosyltransferase
LTQATLIENADSGHGGRGEGQLGDALTIFALSLVAFTFALGPEFIAFQTRFAVFAQNMLRDGPSFFPTLYGQAYPDYPALPTVLIWLLSKPVGRVTPLTAILPTAVASSLILVVVYRIGALRSRQWGLYAVLMTLLTYAFVFSARSISPDQYTALATAASFYVCDSATLLGRRRRLWWLPVLWVLSFACRGPIGLIVPAAVVGVYYLVRREYRAIILVGVGAACLGAACMALLLAAARYQGGEELYREVIRMQASDRLTHKSDSPLEYWLGCFGTYAISYPLAVLVVAACARRVMRRGDPDAMLLACLAAWVLIVLAGMSIPGKKTMRYVLPIAPALGLVAAYAMVDPAPTGLLRRARDGFIVFCRLVAPAATIAAMVTWIARNRFDPPIEGPLLLTAVVLAVLSAAAWLARSRQTCDAGRAARCGGGGHSKRTARSAGVLLDLPGQ